MKNFKTLSLSFSCFQIAFSIISFQCNNVNNIKNNNDSSVYINNDSSVYVGEYPTAHNKNIDGIFIFRKGLTKNQIIDSLNKYKIEFISINKIINPYNIDSLIPEVKNPRPLKYPDTLRKIDQCPDLKLFSCYKIKFADVYIDSLIVAFYKDTIIYTGFQNKFNEQLIGSKKINNKALAEKEMGMVQPIYSNPSYNLQVKKAENLFSKLYNGMEYKYGDADSTNEDDIFKQYPDRRTFGNIYHYWYSSDRLCVIELKNDYFMTFGPRRMDNHYSNYKFNVFFVGSNDYNKIRKCDEKIVNNKYYQDSIKSENAIREKYKKF